MARDIEEFLRKAAERRKQQQAENQGGAAQGSVPRARPVNRPPQQRRAISPEIVEAVEVVEEEIVEAQPVRSRGASRPNVRGPGGGSPVKSYIDTSKIARHAEGLGSLKAQAIGDVDQVKQKFDRDARKFESKHATRDNTDADIVGQEISAVASDLIDMLRDPKSIRQAILVSEILRRPDFDDDEL